MQREGSRELDRGAQTMAIELYRVQTAQWEYTDSLERRGVAFLRSDEAILLFIGLNGLREGFWKSKDCLAVFVIP